VSRHAPRAVAVTAALLRRLSLPKPDDDASKDERGRVLVIGGSMQVAGAVRLAGEAALRSGAGKLQMATVASSAAVLGMAVPESLVVALPETRSGEIAGSRAPALLAKHVSGVDAMLVGPGMQSARAAHALLAALVGRMRDDATLIVDAAAIQALHADETLLASLDGRAVLTPHAGEMASLLGVEKEAVEAAPAELALGAAGRFGAVVVLKGATSWIATPDGALYRYDGGNVGLATSGSGDTLAGIVAGLSARGAPPLNAVVWGVWLHGSAGRALTRRMGALGFLARELLAEIPPLLRRRA
jgi:ADP-dependent NAD(P)H-hydrate dehydratase